MRECGNSVVTAAWVGSGPPGRCWCWCWCWCWQAVLWLAGGYAPSSRVVGHLERVGELLAHVRVVPKPATLRRVRHGAAREPPPAVGCWLATAAVAQNGTWDDRVIRPVSDACPSIASRWSISRWVFGCSGPNGGRSPKHWHCPLQARPAQRLCFRATGCSSARHGRSITVEPINLSTTRFGVATRGRGRAKVGNGREKVPLNWTCMRRGLRRRSVGAHPLQLPPPAVRSAVRRARPRTSDLDLLEPPSRQSGRSSASGSERESGAISFRRPRHSQTPPVSARDQNAQIPSRGASVRVRVRESEQASPSSEHGAVPRRRTAFSVAALRLHRLPSALLPWPL